VIVVGSGPSGAQAAHTAVAHGAKVALVDVGHVDDTYAGTVPDRPFSEVRRYDPAQSRFFLGEHLEGALHDTRAVGAQLTPPRKHIIRDTARLLPVESDTFAPLQSLALGGLGAGWGAGASTYEPAELRRAGLPPEAVTRYYDPLARDIGVSGPADDDTSPHHAALTALQPPLDVDSNGEALLRTYAAKRRRLNTQGFKVGRLPLAVLSEPLGRRQPNPYHDMDFWSDHRESVYRPGLTVTELTAQPNFTHVNRTLATRFSDEGRGRVVVHGDNVDTGGRVTLTCRRLVLAAGAVNTARLALRSLSGPGTRVPLLCNPYTYLPVLNLPMLGRPARDRRHSFAQVTGLLVPPDHPEEQVVANCFSYRSLLLFKLVREMPLPPALGLQLTRLIVTSLVVVGIHHPDAPSTDRYLTLQDTGNGGDVLTARVARSDAETGTERRRERQILRHLVTLRCLPLHVIRLMTGASIHYAGTLPFADDEGPLTCAHDGRLRPTTSVYVADSAPWRFLPAKGLTFTLMANARRVADAVIASLERTP
jgi:hypothetical protein